MSDRPNVVLLLTDQQQAGALGAVDDGYRTPNLDRLVDDGTLFTGCHSTHPQCSPARSSIVTGQYPHQTGMYTLPDWEPGPLDTGVPSVARAFRDTGYETVYVGKWHLGEDTVEALGWDRTANVHETANPPEGTPGDTTTRDRAIEYLDAHDGRTPFFLTVSFNLPHPGFYEDPGFADWYDREAVELPANFDDNLADKPEFHSERALECGGGELLTEAAVREMRYKYRTMVSRVDDHVGRVLDALAANDFREDTVVAFVSDHGDMQGSHRLSKKGVVAYDEILRVPLVVDVPGRESRRERVPDLVSLADLPGTLLAAAGVPRGGFPGGSVLDALDRESPPDDERVFFEHKYAYWGEHPYRGVRTRDWKYVQYFEDPTDELYHVSEDPGETTNHSGNPEYEGHERRLRDSVRAWWDRTGGDDEQWTEPVER
jgi:choline-sulfatase